MTISVFLAIALIIFSIFLHELGHALYMQKYEVSIDTFSIGLPCPIKIRFRSERIFNGATLQFTPFLLGAYVQPTSGSDEVMENMPYSKQADIYGAGVLANILFALTLMLVYKIVAPGVTLDSKFFLILGILVLLYFGRKIFSRYILLPIGLSLLGLTTWAIFQEPTEAMVGPAGIVKMVGEHSSNIPEAILIAAILSLLVGLTNALPLYPFDGGRIMDATLRKWNAGFQIISFFRKTTGTLTFLLIALAIFSDCAR